MKAFPEVTLKQLDLEGTVFQEYFSPSFIAMNVGNNQPGGAWYIYEDLPSYNPHSGEWESCGFARQVRCDCTEGLVDTPMFQRFIRAECSVMKIVEETEGEPGYPDDAYLQRTIED